MSKCFRRYYSYETNEVVNEVCEFTKDNYDELFRKWLGGDYKPYILDAELDANGIYMYINSNIEDPIAWKNMEGKSVLELINNVDGKEEIGSAYIKGCLIFAKRNKQGNPKSLTKSDIEGLNDYLFRYEKKIIQVEISSVREATKDVDGFVALAKNNSSNKEEFLEIINTVLQNCNIKIERKVNKLRKGNLDMSDTINLIYEKMHSDLLEEGNTLFEEMISYCQDELENPDVNKKMKRNYRHILDSIDYVYFHDDDHQMFLSTFIECLGVDDPDLEEEPLYKSINDLFILEEKIKGVDRLIDKGNYIEAQKLYNKAFKMFRSILDETGKVENEFVLNEFEEILQYDLEGLQADTGYKKMLEKLLVQYKNI